MKSFRFSLQSVMEWHSRQADAERSELERMHGTKRDLVARREAIQAELQELRGKLTGERLWTAHDLCQAALYERSLADRGTEIRGQELQWDERIELQREKCVDTNRKYRLLEKFRERRLGEWQRSFDAETEAAAASSYLAKWSRESLT